MEDAKGFRRSPHQARSVIVSLLLGDGKVMADIFLSYASQDRERIKPLVEAIENQGFSIWWDRKLDVGTAFDREIEAEIDQAKCIVVIWSKESLNSDWVRAEANEGLENQTIVPILIDDVKPPLAFRTLQTPRLLDWPRIRSAEALNSVILAIGEKVSPAESPSEETIEADNLLPEKSIAVLPFRSLSPNPDDKYFAQGLADEIRTVLSKIPDLEVASSTSSYQFLDGAGGDSRAIGTQLNVRFLLEGSVRKSGNQLRVTIEFVEAFDGYTVWSKTYNDTLDDIFAVQDEIASRTANALKSTLWETVLEHQARNRTENSLAYQEYLLAMHYDREMHQGGPEALDLVRKHAENAVELDSEFIPAWVMLADVYLNRMGYRMPISEAHPLAKNALDNAIRLDPNNVDVQLQLAELTRGNHQYAEALDIYQRVRELDRTSPQVEYATLLFTVGRLEQALQEFEHCIEMDPENFSLWFYRAATYFGAGNAKQAIEDYKKSLSITAGGFLTDGVCAALAGTLFLNGQHAEAKEMLGRCPRTNPDRTEFEQGVIGGIHGIMGDKDRATEIAAELEEQRLKAYVDPQALFWAYFGMDDKEKTFHWMEKVVDDDSFPTIYFLKTWPLFDHLREDERYDELLIKAGIAQID